LRSTRRVVVAFAGLLVTGCSGSTGPKQPATPAAILSIDTTAALPGNTVSVPLRLERPDGNEPRLDSLDRFELLICYDSSALSLIESVAGPAISQWEYFTYRTVQRSLCPSCGLQTLRGQSQS